MLSYLHIITLLNYSILYTYLLNACLILLSYLVAYAKFVSFFNISLHSIYYTSCLFCYSF